jgi:hypothetical protein
MKRLLFLSICFLLFFPVVLFGQYSSYYGSYSGNTNKVDVNVNSKVDINQDIKVSGHTTQTIKTIDYGALSIANAEREKTRLQAQQYADDKSRQQAIDIAKNPINAFNYGQQASYSLPSIKSWENSSDKREYKRIVQNWGFKFIRIRYTFLHKSLFNYFGGGWKWLGHIRFENISSNGITTEFTLPSITQMKAEDVAKNTSPRPAEKIAKMEDIIVGELNEGLNGQIFVHKKDVNRATIFGQKGFKGSLIWEGDYDYGITDNYTAIWQTSKGKTLIAKGEIRYFGDKDEVTFEDLEGRRYYLHIAIEKVFSSAKFWDEVLINDW